ncbi:replication/maintenance protein RepL [Clostridium perfringens]|nr:replication/maintenance protein RepL [Clostridium perfringens]MDK0850256.1 replication/maintenance protein RepL [Clostridium perfringens]MDM0743567.1 replication/maintenance protein RepL [Clostridium perfringens]MDM0775482.1 replication/maintenance protein RepL [Clostridium perfringens]
MDKVIVNLNRIDDILSLRKSEQLLFFKLVKLISYKDNNCNNIVILDSDNRIRIAKELDVEVASLNSTLSRLIKKNLIVRKTNGVYIVEQNLIELI